MDFCQKCLEHEFRSMLRQRYKSIIISAFDDAGLDHDEYDVFYVTQHLKKSKELKTAFKNDAEKMQAFADFQQHVTKTSDEFSKEIDETWFDLYESFSAMAETQAREFVAGEKDSEDEDDSEIEKGSEDEYYSSSDEYSSSDSSSDEEN